jgi:hypothetical protein
MSLEADYAALRGWMALEAGDTAAARRHFNVALLAAAPYDRNVALSTVVGLSMAAQRPPAQRGPLWAVHDWLPLPSLPLARMGLFYLDNAAAKVR